MKEKDLFWLSFCSLFGAWKIVGKIAHENVSRQVLHEKEPGK